MKKSTAYYAILGLILFSASCSKSNDGGGSSSGNKISIQVVEYKTDTFIVGALVEYYKKCPECILGGYRLVFSDHTGYGGTCNIPEEIFNNISYGIVITPPPPLQIPGLDYYYWQTGSPAEHSTSRRYFLPITGDEIIHLVKLNNFPKGYYMELKARGEQSKLQVIDIATIYAFPSDTSFSFYTYRGQTNTITWNIYDSTNAVIATGGPLMIDFPKVGKQEIEIKY